MARMLAIASESGPDTVAKLKAKLKGLRPPGAEKTISGSEAPDVPKTQEVIEAPTAQELGGTTDTKAVGVPGVDRALTGRDVEWGEYDLDFNVAHLYRDAVYRETPEGPKWVAVVPDFRSALREFGNNSLNKKVNAPGSSDGGQQEWLNLGQYLKDMTAGRDRWKIAAVMPVGTQCGVLLEREVPLILPDPRPLQQKEEVEAPTSPELKTVEDAALAYMENEGLTPVASVEHDTTPEPASVNLRPIERGSAEHEQVLESLEDGAVPVRSARAIETALAMNRGEQLPPPVPKGIQPDAIENPLLGNKPQAAGGYQAANDLLRALTDPTFRASLPQED